MFFLFTWYIPYFAQNDASVSYNFYQVSTPLRLIIYYFWKFSKYFPTYTQPLLRAVSLFCLYLTRTTWKKKKTNQQQARASIAAIVLCTDIIHAFLSGKVVHFFANTALFASNPALLEIGWKFVQNCGRRCFLAALGAAHRWADNLLATIEFSGWRFERISRWTSSATNIFSSLKQIQNHAAATIIEQKLDRSEKPRQTLPTFAPRCQPLKVHYLIFSAIQLQLQLRNRNMWVPSRKITVRSVPAIELKNISWSFRQLSHFP